MDPWLLSVITVLDEVLAVQLSAGYCVWVCACVFFLQNASQLPTDAAATSASTTTDGLQFYTHIHTHTYANAHTYIQKLCHIYHRQSKKKLKVACSTIKICNR